jgi:hypothetical protein
MGCDSSLRSENEQSSRIRVWQHQRHPRYQLHSGIHGLPAPTSEDPLARKIVASVESRRLATTAPSDILVWNIHSDERVERPHPPDCGSERPKRSAQRALSGGHFGKGPTEARKPLNLNLLPLPTPEQHDRNNSRHGFCDQDRPIDSALFGAQMEGQKVGQRNFQ